MSYKIETISPFDRQFKKLFNKYPSLKTDVINLAAELSENPFTGNSLGNNCYKVRMAISSKNKGKSGGARIITNVYIENETVYLLSIYDKSEQDSISDDEIKHLLSFIVH